MDPYNPAKYALRAPPPIPPRPGVSPVTSPRSDGPGPPLPPRPTSTPQSFPPPPRRHVQQEAQPPEYQQAYNLGQYPPPPAQTYHYTPSLAPSHPPLQSALQSAQPPSYAPAPPTAQVSSSPQVPNHGESAAVAQYATREEFTQPSYRPPATPTYPPPPTNPQVASYGAPPVGETSAQQATAQAQASPLSSYHPPLPPVSDPAVPTYPAHPKGNSNAQPPGHKNATQRVTAQLQVTQSPSYQPPPPVSTPATPPYPPRPSHPDTDYRPPISGRGYDQGQPKPDLAQLSAHHSPPATSATYDPLCTSSPQAPNKPHGTAGRYAAGAAVLSSPPRAPSPYQPESGAFINYPPPSYEQPQDPPPPAGPPPPSGSLSRMESLTEALSHTRISAGAETPTEPRSQPRSKTPARPPIQYNAPTKFTLRQCPSTEYTFTGEGQWYFHPQIPDFRICVYCYEKHIQSTRLECEFYAWTSPAGSSPQCLFSCPRLEDDIWPRAIISGDLRELLGFFARRLNIPNCPRQRGVPATENIKWYQPRDKQRFPEFLACQACYEDVLLSGALRDEFVLFSGPQAKETLFICDAANPYVRKLATGTTSMDAFISGTIRHLHLHECAKNGALTDGPSRKWYQPRNSSSSSSSITICERCYGEYAAHTEFETNFQLVTRPNAQHRCMLGLWQSRSVWDEALALHDFTLWERTTLEMNSVPLCTLEIARGNPVYQIPGVENFDVCHSCYVGFLKPFGLDRFFQRAPSPVYGQCACDLNAGTPRIAAFAKKLDEAMITATFATFAAFAARLAPTEPCPKLNLVCGWQWYGNESCRICPACYEEVVRDTYLAAYFPPTPITIHEETCCDLYSPRMRSKFKTACTAQDATPFLSFATHRKNVYHQTVPEMRALVERAKHNLSMQQMYNTTSSAYNNMDGISTVGMYDSGIRYTGSGVPGMFRTHWGVEGAAMGQTAMGYMQQTQVDVARVRYLQGVWDGVE